MEATKETEREDAELALGPGGAGGPVLLRRQRRRRHRAQLPRLRPATLGSDICSAVPRETCTYTTVFPLEERSKKSTDISPQQKVQIFDY